MSQDIICLNAEMFKEKSSSAFNRLNSDYGRYKIIFFSFSKRALKRLSKKDNFIIVCLMKRKV